MTMNIEDSFAYGYLKGENGVPTAWCMCLLIMLKTDDFFASVFVTPLVDDSIEVTLLNRLV